MLPFPFPFLSFSFSPPSYAEPITKHSSPDMHVFLLPAWLCMRLWYLHTNLSFIKSQKSCSGPEGQSVGSGEGVEYHELGRIWTHHSLLQSPWHAARTAEPGNSIPSPRHLEWVDATEQPSSPEDWAAQWHKAFVSEMLAHVANKFILAVYMF